jgi:hypothetical protein
MTRNIFDFPAVALEVQIIRPAGGRIYHSAPADTVHYGGYDPTTSASHYTVETPRDHSRMNSKRTQPGTRCDCAASCRHDRQPASAQHEREPFELPAAVTPPQSHWQVARRSSDDPTPRSWIACFIVVARIISALGHFSRIILLHASGNSDGIRNLRRRE